MHSLHRIGLVLLAIVLLPVALYITYEVRRLSENEDLMTQIYERQLEAMLFAVNQHAQNTADGWATKLSLALATPAERPDQSMVRFLQNQPRALQAVFLADSTLRTLHCVDRPDTDACARIKLHPDAAVAQRLLQHKRAGYRKLEPAQLDGQPAAASSEHLALLFVPDYAENDVQLAAIAFEASSFVQDVLAPKLEEISREQFLLGIFQSGQDDPVYATGDLALSEVQQQRSVWLFPDYQLGIRSQGASIEDVVQSRFERNLLLVLLMAAVLLAGVGLVYRSIRHEVALARMKSDFVSNVSHELRTPLALIRMFAETLELGRIHTEEKRRDYYRIISQETERLTRLVNNILNFSRIEAGQKTYEQQPVALNAVIREVLELYEFTLEQQGFRTDVHLDEHLPRIRGDAEALAEALINLIDNAIKYSPDERVLRLTTHRAGERVHLEIADRGIGIAQQEHAKIFDKFYRVSSGLVHTTNGTGLGLALVKHIVEAHGGHIAVESRPGAGTHFRLDFPVPSFEDAPAAVA